MKIVKDFMPLWQNQVNAPDLRQMIIWLDSECGVMRSDRQNDVRNLVPARACRFESCRRRLFFQGVKFKSLTYLIVMFDKNEQ